MMPPLRKELASLALLALILLTAPLWVTGLVLLAAYTKLEALWRGET